MKPCRTNILVVICLSAFTLTSCKSIEERQKEFREIDVANEFIQTLCGNRFGYEYKDFLKNKLPSDAIMFLEKDCWDDFDRFWTDIPNKMEYHDLPDGYDKWSPTDKGDVELVKLDTLKKGEYRATLKLEGKKNHVIDFEVTENNLVRAKFHGKGIGGRYRFDGADDFVVTIYRTRTGKSYEERNPPGSYNLNDHYHEPKIFVSDMEKYRWYYVLKEKGQKRSKIAFQKGSEDYMIEGWVDNKYIIQDEAHRCPYDPTTYERLNNVGGIVCVLWAAFFLKGGGSAAASPNGIAIIFF